MADEYLPWEDPNNYGTSASWDQRGYVPLRGLATPAYWADGIPTDKTCAWCASEDVVGKECHGGLFSCWDRRRFSATQHTDYACLMCERVWSTGVSR